MGETAARPFLQCKPMFTGVLKCLSRPLSIRQAYVYLLKKAHALQHPLFPTLASRPETILRLLRTRFSAFNLEASFLSNDDHSCNRQLQDTEASDPFPVPDSLLAIDVILERENLSMIFCPWSPARLSCGRCMEWLAIDRLSASRCLFFDLNGLARHAMTYRSVLQFLLTRHQRYGEY
jgi:hypothetical protein